MKLPRIAPSPSSLRARKNRRPVLIGSITASIILSGLHAAYSADFTYSGSTGTFSTGFTPALPATINDRLIFGGASAYTATDDVAPVTANALIFNGTGGTALQLVSIVKGAGTSITLGGSNPYINFANTGFSGINYGLDTTFASNGFITKTSNPSAVANPIISGAINLGANNLLIALGDTGGDAAAELFISGAITGSGTITLQNNVAQTGTEIVPGTGTPDWGTLLVSNSNSSFTGAVNIAYGRIVVNNDNALGTGSITVGTSGTTGGTLALGGNNAAGAQNYGGLQGAATGITLANAISLGGITGPDYNAGLINNSGANTLSGIVTLTQANVNLQVNNLSTLTFGQALGSSVAGATLNKAGNGLVVLKNDTGTTFKTVNAGNLAFTGTAPATASTVTIASTGALNTGTAGNSFPTVQSALNSGVINTFSAGVIAITGANGEAANFLNYPTLGLGATATGANFNGTLTPGSSTYFLGGGGGTLTVSGTNTLTGANLVQVGIGPVTLAGANNHSGGTTLNASQLNINNGGALGTGIFTIAGGTIDNTSGTGVVVTTNNPQTWNANITFAGSNALNLGTGPVTPGATRTVTTNGTAPLTVGGNILGTAGIGLVKTGTGSLILTGNNALPSSILVNTGTLGIMGGTTTTGTAGSNSPIQVTTPGNLNATLIIGGSGTITTNTNNQIYLGQAGVGANATMVIQDSGTLNVGGWLAIGRNGGTGTLNMTGGTLNKLGDGFLDIAAGGGNPGSVGVFNQSGGVVNSANTALLLGEIGAANATYNVSSTAIGNFPAITVGDNATATATVNLNGGTLNATVINTIAGSNSTFNFNGGTLTARSGANAAFLNGLTSAYVRNGGAAVAVNGQTITIGQILRHSITAGDNAIDGGLTVSDTGAGTLTLTGASSYTGPTTLNSGTLAYGAGGSAYAGGTLPGNVTVNGGILRFDATDTFGTATSQSPVVFTLNAGGTIASNNTYTSLNNPVFNGGTLILNGGIGTFGAFGLRGTVAVGGTVPTNVNAGLGANDFITLGHQNTNEGTTFAANDVTGDANSDIVINIPLADNGGGSSGLTKTLNGTLALAAINTYTGATLVSAGTLTLTGATSINSSSSITINGANARLVQRSSAALTQPVTVTTGTLDGTSTVNTATVGDGTGGVIANGNGGTDAFSIGSLTFAGIGTFNLSTATTSPVLTVTTLTTGGAGKTITVNAANTSWENGGVYNLISYSTLAGTGFTNFAKGTISGLGARQNATLTNPPGLIALSISGDLPVWTGTISGKWTTNAIPTTKNWKLQGAGSPTDFIASDTVLFDDSSTGVTVIDISDANVTPTSATFNNSTKNYTIMSSGLFGIASGLLVKSGTGSVTLVSSNAYAGGTTFNAGTLNINNASALGTGPVTIAGGTIDNTSGNAITLTTNNVQTWNGDFTFAGTNDLNLGTGAVTMSSSRAVTTATSGRTLTIGGVISGSGFSLTKTGNGTLALGGANTFTGGVTINAGILSLANPGALNAGVPNAVVFGPASNGRLRLNGNNVTVGGLNTDLNPGSAIVEDGATGTASLTVNSATDSTFAGTLQNGSTGALALVKSGVGALTLSGANTHSGGTTLNAGTLNLGNASASGTGPITFAGGTLDNTTGAGFTLPTNNIQTWSGNLTFAGTSDLNLGTGAVTFTGPRTITTNGIATLTIGGTISGGFGMTKLGTGTLTIGANYSATTPLIFNGGTTRIAGGTTIEANTANTQIQIANVAGATATLTVGTGATLDSGVSEIFVGQGGTTSFGTLNLEPGGTINVGFWFAVGRNASTGVFNMTGGTFNKTGPGNISVAPGGGASGNGTFNQSGGILNTSSNFLIGENAAGANGSVNGSTGIYNVSGTAVANIPILNIGTLTGATGTVNLDGGTINAQQVINGLGSGNMTFNGGTLRASAGANSQFLSGLTSAYIRNGGAIFDSNGQTIAVNQELDHSITAGDNPIDGGLTKNGNGMLTIAGFNTYNGPTTVNAGTLFVAGGIAGTVTATGATAILSGNGTVGAVTIQNGATLEPGQFQGLLSSGSLLMSSGTTFSIGINGTAAGFGYEQLGVTGSVNLSQATLSLSGSYLDSSNAHDVFYVILNDDVDAISGTFAGLAEGGTVVASDGQAFEITYKANGEIQSFTGGNDIALMAVVPEPGAAVGLIGGAGVLLGLRRRRMR